PHVRDLGRAALGQQHPDQVNPDPARLSTVLVDPADRELPQSFTLDRSDRLERMAVRRGGARLHLAEDEDITVAENEIDLAEVTSPVAVDEDHPLVDQALGGDSLTVGAEVAVAGTATHARSTPREAARLPPAADCLWTASSRRPLWTRTGQRTSPTSFNFGSGTA